MSKGYDVIGHATTEFVRANNRTVQLKHPGDPDEVLQRLADMRGRPEVVFIAIPPIDKGEVSLTYKLHYLSQGIPVVSAEKRAMAYHPHKLVPYLPILGFDAMVSGNARVISASRERRIRHERVRVFAVLNGTVNHNLTRVQNDGDMLSMACDLARRLGYAEPDDDKADGELRQFRGELYGDVPSKVAVYHNLVCVGKEGPFITPDDFKVNEFDGPDLEWFADAGKRYRYVVVFTNGNVLEKIDINAPGSFTLRKGEWRISGGFLEMPKGTFYGDWVPNGVGNGILIEYLDGHNGPVPLAAPGAGPGPTTDTMFQDADRLLDVPY